MDPISELDPEPEPEPKTGERMKEPKIAKELRRDTAVLSGELNEVLAGELKEALAEENEVRAIKEFIVDLVLEDVLHSSDEE